MAIIVGAVGLVFIVIFGGVIGVMGWLLKKQYAKAGKIRNTPLTKIAELKQGLAKTRGKVVAHDKLLRTPLSGKKCICYHVLVQETQSSGSGRNRTTTYITHVNDKKSIDVSVQDDSGQADLDLKTAEIYAQASDSRKSDSALNERLKALYGLKTSGLIFNKSYSVRESYIPPDAEVYVIGDVELREGLNPCFRKGENELMISDKSQEDFARTHNIYIIVLWVAIGVMGAMLLLTCVSLIIVELFMTMTFGLGMPRLP
jgi:hypothetical protein